MDAYHVIMVHFPIALWMTATLAIVFRAVSDGPLARAMQRVLVPLLPLGLLAGVVAFGIGLLVWPWETLTASALGRNHLLLASWTVCYWAVLLFVLWRQGDAVWQGVSRLIMAGLALLGSGLLAITGTLGGLLVGINDALPSMLRSLGWEVYTTFYLPSVTLLACAVVSAALLGLGFWRRDTV